MHIYVYTEREGERQKKNMAKPTTLLSNFPPIKK